MTCAGCGAEVAPGTRWCDADRAGITILKTAYVPLAGHQALQLTVTNPTLTHGANVTIVQDFVAANDLMYVVTFSGTNRDFQVIAATFSVS